MNVYIPTDSDIPGLEKKFEVEAFLIYPKANSVTVIANPIYFSGDRTLRDVTGEGKKTFQTDMGNIGTMEPEQLSVDTIEAAVPAIMNFALTKIAEELAAGNTGS